EELLVGRVETATSQIEARGAAAANAIANRIEQLNQTAKTAAGEIERTLSGLATSTADTVRGSAQDAQRSLVLLASSTSEAIRAGAQEASQSLEAAAASATAAI